MLAWLGGGTHLPLHVPPPPEGTVSQGACCHIPSCFPYQHDCTCCHPTCCRCPLAVRYRSTWGTLLHISRHEGPSSLYRGFLPKAIRLGVGQTIGLMVFQKCLALVGASEAQHERQQMIVMEGVAVAEQ
jgi:hypothetical protein